MFYVVHDDEVTFAAKAPEGELMSPRHTTRDLKAAASFETWGDASDVSQNFGPEWDVEEI